MIDNKLKPFSLIQVSKKAKSNGRKVSFVTKVFCKSAYIFGTQILERIQIYSYLTETISTTLER